MKLKAEALERIINNQISELKHGYYEATSFAIYIQDGIEVQVKITKDEEDFFGELHTEYLEEQ